MNTTPMSSLNVFGVVGTLRDFRNLPPAPIFRDADGRFVCLLRCRDGYSPKSAMGLEVVQDLRVPADDDANWVASPREHVIPAAPPRFLAQVSPATPAPSTDCEEKPGAITADSPPEQGTTAPDATSGGLLDAALRYASLGWPVIACGAGSKEPRFKGGGGVNGATTDETKIRYWWSIEPNANIGIRCGPESFTVIDADGPEGNEAYAALREQHDLPDAFVQESPNGTHYLFAYSPLIGCTQSKLAQKIDTRGQGKGYILVAPSQVNGKSYKFPVPLNGEAPRLAELPESILSLFRSVGEGPRYESVEAQPAPSKSAAPTPSLSSDTQFIEQRAALWLAQCDPAVAGQGGHSRLLWAARGLVRGFRLTPLTALRMLWSDYNPRCVPPWDPGQPAEKKDFERKVREASKPFDKPLGWLLEEHGLPSQSARAEGRAAIASIMGDDNDSIGDEAQEPRCIRDPGPIEDELLDSPGFIRELMDWTLTTAPYPNALAAFGAAVALQAYLAGRKVRDVADNRANIYVLTLANSGSGKDHPRKTNFAVAHAADLSDGIICDVASAQGLEDFLKVQPAALWQADEMDGLIRAMANGREASFEAIRGILLRLFSEANGTHKTRLKAATSWSQENGCNTEPVIVNPALTILGSAIPEHFYGALNDRMITCGFLPRMLILEGAHIRRVGQEPGLISHPPPRLVETAQWWKAFNPGGGNLNMMANADPTPKEVPQSDGAKRLLNEIRRDFDRPWDEAQADGNSIATSIWARANELTRKLALIFAVSACHETPVIDVSDVRRARDIIRHQVRRMLFMVETHVGGTWFEQQSQRMLSRLRGMRGGRASHSDLLRRLKLPAKQFKDLMSTLEERGDVEKIVRQRSGTPLVIYQLKDGQA